MNIENAIKAGELAKEINSLKEQIALFESPKNKDAIENHFSKQISFGFIETNFASPFGPKITSFPKKYNQKVLDLFKEVLQDLEKELEELC
jgi:hypothetical protein